MKNSQHRILTTQAGSLPRPDDLIELTRARQEGETTDEAGYQAQLAAAVQDVVRRQRECGIDIAGDGEYGKGMGQKINYGAWWSYSFQRLGGLRLGDYMYRMPPNRREGDAIVLTAFPDRRDRNLFPTAYADPDSGVSSNRGGPGMRLPVCVDKLTYTGHDAIAADIAHFKAALQAVGIEEGFMTSIAPGSCSRIGNEYYKTEEEFIYACADAMREEYKAIIDAGLVLQLDDPSIAENWDQINPAPTVERVPQVFHDPGGSAEPRDQGSAAGPHPVPSVLGKLARPARHRHPNAGNRRCDAGDQRPGLLVRSGQCPARA